jgi:hypothetical protein
VSNVQIPNLPAAGALTGTEQLELVQAGVSVRATIAQIVTDAQVPTASDTLPGMDGGASAGVEVTYSRGDHIHPTDTSRYAASNPANYVTAAALGPYALIDSQAFTGTPSMPTGATGVTQAAADSSTKLATTAFVKAQGYQVASALGTMSTQNANSVAITGGAINGTTVGATTPSTGAFTNLSASGTVSGAGFTALLAPYALTANVPVASSTNPSMDGTVAIGVGTTWARADHVHPSDTSRYAASNPAGYQTAAQVTASLGPYALINSQVFTGTPSLPTGTIGVTQAPGDSSTKLATTAFVGAATTALGLGTMAAQNANSVAITGGAINNTAIGATTRSSGAFTTLAANGAATFTSSLTASPASANVTLSPTGTGTVIINPATAGSIDNTAVGATTPSTGKFTTLSATSINSTPIGPTTPSTGAFTTLSANGAATFTGSLTASPASANVTFSPTGTGTVTINPATLGHVDNTAVGATTPSTGAFTNLSATGTVSGAGFTTLLNPYALVNSQVFTGTPSLPTGTIGVTQATATNNTTLATTAFVKAQAYLTGNQTITHTGDATGSGTTSIPMTVVQLQGRPLAATAPATGNLMGWNGSTWGPVAAGAAAAGGTNGQIQYNNGGVLGGLTLNGTGNPVGTTSPTLAGSVVINGTALGSVAGNSQIVFSPGSTDTNGESLRTEIQRKSAGSDWSTAAWQIYRQVDSTKMGYIEFNSGSSKPIAFGNGVTEHAYFDSGKNLTIFGNVAATEVSYTNGVNPAVVLSKSASGGTSRIVGSMAGSPRWQEMLGDASAESGSNAGSNYGLQRYTDAGVLIDAPFAINRASGIATFSQGVAAASYTVNALAATDAALYLNKPASGRASTVYGQMAGSTRWGMNFGDSGAEATGNVGSDFGLARFDNTGAFIDNPLTINRATGAVTLNQTNSSGVLNLTATAGVWPQISLNKAASGVGAVVTGTKAGVARWQVSLGDQTAEGTANAGSNFTISTFSDAGAYVGSPFLIERASGYLRLNGNGATPTTASPAPFGHSQVVLNKAGSTKACNIVGQNNALPRWEIDIGDTTAESGSNAGSNFGIARFNDAGAGIDYPFSILRSSGIATFSKAVVVQSFDNLGQLRLVGGNYGAGIRNDGASCYLLQTAVSDQYGAFSTARPFSWNLSNGAVNIDGGAAGTTFGGAISTSGQIYTSGSIIGSGIYASGGQMTVQTSGANGYINQCDASGNGGQFRNLTIRGLDAGYSGQVNLSAITLATALVTSNGIIDATNGFRCRLGAPGGALGANVFSYFWNTDNHLYGSVDATNLGWIAWSSDYRIKRDIAPLPSMWDRVKALKPISYFHKDWTPEWEAPKENGDAPDPLFRDDGVENWGFVAHELQETLIQSAATGVKDEAGLVQAPNPWTVIATLTKALQEAMARIEALEARP